MIRKYIFLLILFPSSAWPMEVKPKIAMLSKKKKVGSLKNLAVTCCVNAFDPDNKTKLELLKKLANQVDVLPVELQALVKQRIESKALLFESINNAKKVQLGPSMGMDILGKYRSPVALSPDSTHICYFTQPRQYWQEGRKKYLTLVNIIKNNSTFIEHAGICYNPEDARVIPSQFLFTQDSRSLVFTACHYAYQRNIPSKPTTLYSYDLHTNKTTRIMSLPEDASLAAATADLKEIIFENDDSSLIAFKTDLYENPKIINEKLLQVSPDYKHIMTYEKKSKIVYCRALDGTPTFNLVFPLTKNDGPVRKDTIIYPAFNKTGSQVAMACESRVMIKDVESGKLIARITYPAKVLDLSFRDNGELLVNEFITDITTGIIRKGILTSSNAYIVRDLCICTQDSQCHLYHLDQQQVIKIYDQEKGVLLHGITPDASAIIVQCAIDKGLDSALCLYPTYCAITNDASAQDLLELLIAEKQRRDGSAVDDALIERLKKSPSKRLREVVQERYETKRK